MGGILILVAAILLAVWAMFQSNQPATLTTAGDRPAIEVVAANMIEMHRAAVTFVSLTQNRNPSSGNWAWTLSTPGSVRCTGTYPTNSVSGTCTAPTTEMRLPSYLANLYDWNVYYRSDGAGGSDDIVVTYAATSSDLMGGYTSQQIGRALAAYAPSLGWTYGVTTASTPATLLKSDATVLTLPIGNQQVVALATIIP